MVLEQKHEIQYRKTAFTPFTLETNNIVLLTIVQRDATQNSLFIILQVQSTCFGCQPHPSSGLHKTVTTASVTGHIFGAATSLQRGQASLATLEGGGCTKNMTSNAGCSYSFVYS